MKWPLPLLLCALAQTPALAQTVYRCGSTFSQAPCGEQAQELGVRAPVASSPAAQHRQRVERIQAECTEQIRRAARWPAGEALRIDGPHRGQPQLRTIQGVRVMAYPYQARLFDRDSERTFTCHANEGETRILELQLGP